MMGMLHRLTLLVSAIRITKFYPTTTSLTLIVFEYLTSQGYISSANGCAISRVHAHASSRTRHGLADFGAASQTTAIDPLHLKQQ